MSLSLNRRKDIKFSKLYIFRLRLIGSFIVSFDY